MVSKRATIKILQAFWNNFEATDSVTKRLELLKEFDKQHSRRSISKQELTSRRQDFKQSKHFNYFKENCKVCLKFPVIRHHLIELQHGGLNVYSNIMPLCRECHATIHPWLATKGVKMNYVQV
jgi:5-methylcytosine-specific restriction endonuclease McrA